MKRFYVSTAWEGEYVVRDTQTQRPEGGHAIVAEGVWTGSWGKELAQERCDQMNARSSQSALTSPEIMEAL